MMARAKIRAIEAYQCNNYIGPYKDLISDEDLEYKGIHYSVSKANFYCCENSAGICNWENAYNGWRRSPEHCANLEDSDLIGYASFHGECIYIGRYDLESAAYNGFSDEYFNKVVYYIGSGLKVPDDWDK